MSKFSRRVTIHRMVKRGALAPARDLPCCDCGGPAVEYDHFKGYETNAVEAVCRPCHIKRGVSRGEYTGPERPVIKVWGRTAREAISRLEAALRKTPVVLKPYLPMTPAPPSS